ncbi:uncharacterized protein TRUGW13939_02332 [Talaromyces rugulosus]|uniref:Fungal lipase-type domain-containing protein n=1 Tax=Talaromyces rugulosus TaxID=121627 RepID=A0A7H8QMU3_TALRU|nr:uncharacterized protein TRUGW13939_02332 [Talaromyces rugulosus]QKX55240.1 hypothetical protein TRUGW13939_02332 [Talaromyces rugulosus]
MRYSLLLASLSCLVLGHPVRDSNTKTPVTPEIYEKLVRYAEYPDLSLGQCSKVSTGATVIQFFNITSTDTQAAFWKLPSEKQIIVSIPGTDGTEDYLTDFNFFFTGYDSPGVKCPEGCLVHNGFLGSWNSLATELIPALEDVLDANPDYNTIITGHSLGGALAQLAFASLITDPKYRVLEAYTYGQPRVGNGIFANYIDALAGASDDDIGIFRRVTHYNDGVPLLPPRIFGFSHSLTEFWESTNKSEESTTYRCYGHESSECNDSAGGFGINAAHGSYAGFGATCQ